MAALGKVNFKGESGKQYPFKVYALGTRFRKTGGVYVVARRSMGDNGMHRLAILYVGQTEDFSRPFKKHRKSRQFAQRGANCVCFQSDDCEESRVEKGRDLAAGLHPSCNT